MFRTASPRILASAAAVALAAGLFAAPAAYAGTEGRATDPAVVPSPGFLSTGARTDACDTTTVPGWVATGSPALTVRTAGVEARFKVLDATGQKVFDATGTATDGTATARPTGLTDGQVYTWWAKGDGGGAPTAECHFRVDTAAPTLAVDSADFPGSDSGRTPQKYAGQTGTFTITGSDASSGVACYRYVLNGTLSTGGGCDASGTVRPAADGSASIQLKPAQWGTNVLTVQAYDEAGNASQPLAYTFYAPSDPNPPSTPGDVDGDGTPDILLPDAAGDLQIISAAATDTRPASVVPASAAPVAGTTWADWQVAHRGWDNHAPADDLMVHRPGASWVYLYRNTQAGQFGGQGATGLNRPTSCGAVACPADYAADWAKSTQLVSLGALGTGTRPSVLSVEDGNLWLFTDTGIMFRFKTVRKLSTNGAWDGYDLIAPGAAADGTLAVWSREKATGTLRSYPVTKAADGSYDFSSLADPASGTAVGTFPVADYPVLGSSGDGNGDGRPDLYAVTAARHLLTFDGTAAPKDLGVLG